MKLFYACLGLVFGSSLALAETDNQTPDQGACPDINQRQLIAMGDFSPNAFRRPLSLIVRYDIDQTGQTQNVDILRRRGRLSETREIGRVMESIVFEPNSEEATPVQGCVLRLNASRRDRFMSDSHLNNIRRSREYRDFYDPLPN